MHTYIRRLLVWAAIHQRRDGHIGWTGTGPRSSVGRRHAQPGSLLVGDQFPHITPGSPSPRAAISAASDPSKRIRAGRQAHASVGHGSHKAVATAAAPLCTAIQEPLRTVDTIPDGNTTAVWASSSDSNVLTVFVQRGTTDAKWNTLPKRHEGAW